MAAPPTRNKQLGISMERSLPKYLAGEKRRISRSAHIGWGGFVAKVPGAGQRQHGLIGRGGGGRGGWCSACPPITLPRCDTMLIRPSAPLFLRPALGSPVLRDILGGQNERVSRRVDLQHLSCEVDGDRAARWKMVEGNQRKEGDHRARNQKNRGSMAQPGLLVPGRRPSPPKLATPAAAAPLSPAGV